MILFYQASPDHQAMLLSAMFLTILLSLFCIGLSRGGKRNMPHMLIDIAVFLILLAFVVECSIAVRHIRLGLSPVNLLWIPPVWALWCFTICAVAWLIFEVVKNLRRLNSTISRRSIKDAMDTLPSAICYFTPSGAVKLCNLQMHRLFRSMTQSDLQTLDELRQALAECDGNSGVIKLSDERQTYLFPDGKVWRYKQTEVTAKTGITYTETMFSDVTELYEKHRELERRNAELKEMYRDIKRLSDNVLEMTREDEILTAKTNLHDQMGAGVVAIRQILQQHHTSEKNAAAVELLYRAVKVIKNDNESPVGRGDVEEIIHDASVVGIRVKMTGSLPEEENVRRLLLLAMKESLTNAVRHADATVLWITVEESNGTVSIRIENDGKPPKCEVTPRGGLLNLSRHLEECGGRMEIQSNPRFTLTVTVPSMGAKKKGVLK